MVGNITFLAIFFDPSQLTLWINCSFKYLYLLFYGQNCVICNCVTTTTTDIKARLPKIKNLSLCHMLGTNMHYHAKSNQNRSNGCRDMAI